MTLNSLGMALIQRPRQQSPTPTDNVINVDMDKAQSVPASNVAPETQDTPYVIFVGRNYDVKR